MEQRLQEESEERAEVEKGLKNDKDEYTLKLQKYADDNSNKQKELQNLKKELQSIKSEYKVLLLSLLLPLLLSLCLF